MVGNFAFKWGMHPGNLQMLQTSAIMRPLPLGYRRGGGAELTPPPPSGPGPRPTCSNLGPVRVWPTFPIYYDYEPTVDESKAFFKVQISA